MNEILLEYYAGRNKDLIKAEGYCREIVDTIKKRPLPSNKLQVVTEDFPANKKLEKALEDTFNVKSVRIYYKRNSPNAYTVMPSVFTCLDSSKKLSKGVSSNLNIHICVYESLITQCNINERELLALILHEIGHNFYWCPLSIVRECVLMTLAFPQWLINNLIVKNVIKIVDNISNQIKKHVPGLYNVYGEIVELVGDLSRFANTFYLPQALLMSLVIKLQTLDFGIEDYGNEKAADTMAARFGYGSDLASALHKLEALDNTIYTKSLKTMGEFGKIWSDVNMVGMDLLTMLSFDPHPQTGIRVKTMLNKLKRDMKNGEYPPAMKKDLEQEIAKLEKAYETIDKNPQFKDSKTRENVLRFFDTITGGRRDIREFLNAYYDKYQF